ncbi:MAG: ribonuclease III [Holosporaceae bacterium]|jgi:ribonuclease III|nr:ribonuclease III [Holosporaceae bacterium]
MSPSKQAAELQKIIGYKFKNPELIEAALSHPGLPKKTPGKTFERLEFLGDRVLGLSLSSLLYEKFPRADEGQLAMKIAVLAGTDFLIALAKKTKILDCFMIPKDFFVSVNKNSSSIADMTEAVFGAIFLDSDFETVKNIIGKLWQDDVDKGIYGKKDAKSRLQEIVQAEYAELPVYRLVKVTGEAHDPIFETEVTAAGVSAVGCGNSKKSSEHEAAERLTAKLAAIN